MELECDLAETYGVFNMREYNPFKVAILSYGLKSDSRVKMKINSLSYPLEIVLLASCLDKLNLLLWQNTKDGRKGKNRPKSVAKNFLETTKNETEDIQSFNTSEEFNARRKELINEVKKKCQN